MGVEVMATQFPGFPERLQALVETAVPGLHAWFTDIVRFIRVALVTGGDVTLTGAGKGVVLKNATGIVKRIKLNSAGTDIELEDV
jgi:hypothetical protein